MSDFHEPWVYDEGGDYGITDCNESFVTNDILIDEEYGKRIIACVNAMAGIEDPRAFMRAARRGIESLGCHGTDHGMSALHDMEDEVDSNPPEIPDSSKEED